MKLSEKFKNKRKHKTEQGIFALDFVNLKTYEEICRLEASLDEANRIDKKLVFIQEKSDGIFDFVSRFRALEIYKASVEKSERRLSQLKEEHCL